MSLVLASLTYFQSIVLGLVQGVTELFPVSSLGHGVLLPALLGWHNLVKSQSQSESFFLAFLVGLHVGTALGLIVFYWRTWLSLFKGFFTQLGKSRTAGVSSLWKLSRPDIDPQYRLLFLLVIATIPVGIVGLLLEHKLRVLFTKPLDAAIFLCANGVILLGGELLRRRSRPAHRRSVDLDTLRPRNALIIGSSQILALFAGISRSGVSIVTGLSKQLDYENAAEFAFLLATPVILLAGVLKLPDLFGPLGNGIRMQAFVGALFAAVAAYFSVRFLTKWFTTRTLWPFGVYSLIVGIACVVRFG